MCLGERKALSRLLVILLLYWAFAFAVVVVVLAINAFQAFLTCPVGLFFAVLSYICALMLSILNNKVPVAVLTRSLDQIIPFITGFTLLQILRREWFVTGALLYWIILPLQIFQFIINWFTASVIGNPVLTGIIVWFLVDLLTFVGFVDVFLLVLA